MRRPPSSTLFPYTTLFDLVARAQPAAILLEGEYVYGDVLVLSPAVLPAQHVPRSEEHTSELQSHSDLVCRLLLEKKKRKHVLAPHERTHPTLNAPRRTDAH